MPWFRRTDPESLDPQDLLARAHAVTPQPLEQSGAAGDGFRLTVQDVFAIAGRGTVVTGRIESGTISEGARVRLTRADGTMRQSTVTGIEMFRKVHDTAAAGDNVGLLLRDLARDDVARGDILTA